MSYSFLIFNKMLISKVIYKNVLYGLHFYNQKAWMIEDENINLP